jgi:hypothetical protein
LSAAGEAGVAGVRIIARGIAASMRAGREDVVPAAHAEVQAATSGRAGEFTLCGLPPGSFQIDVASPGLVTLPQDVEVSNEMWAFEMGRRGVTVDVPGPPIEFRALPVACAMISIESAVDGGMVPSATIRADLGEGLLPWTRALGANSNVVVANGRQFDGRTGLGGTSALLVACRSWPVEERTASVTVLAPGFVTAKARVPLWPLGEAESVPRSVVRLEPEGRRGGVALRARDARGEVLGCISGTLSVRPLGEGLASHIEFSTDGNGASPVISIPVGVYGPDQPADVPTMWRCDVFEVTEDRVAQVELTLVVGAIRITVRGERGETLDDVGLLLDRGHGPVRRNHKREGAKVTISGLFVQCPGLGPLPTGLRCVSSGPWTVEAYRHGYEPGRVMFEALAGESQDVEIRLRENAQIRWDTWIREPVTRFDEVVLPGHVR